MLMKTKKPKSVHPFERIQEWSVVPKIHALFINVNPTEVSWYGDETLDIEHDGNGNFVGLGIFVPKLNSCFYWSELPKDLYIGDFIAHNGISDIKCLQKWGFNVTENNLIWDTMLMAHILDSSRKNYGLKALAKADLGAEWPSYDEIVGKKREKTLLDFPVEAIADYNAADCYYTYKLYELQSKQMDLNSKEIQYFDSLEKPVSVVFKSMENRGIRIDRPYLLQLKEELEAQKAPLEEEINNELGPLNLNSPKQLLEALHAKEIFPELKNKASTDKRALERLKGIPVVSKLLAFSEVETLLSSFVNPYLERNVEIVNPYFNQVGTRTGRPSCSNPNLLQIPRRTENGKKVRKMFIPRDGYLLGCCDYGQIEPRLLAHLSGDSDMCEMFTKGANFHTYTSEKLQIDRERAKILNLSVGYRATFKSVSQQLKCSNQEAQGIIDDWWAMFPNLKAWQQQLIWKTKKEGYFTTLLGRKIKVEGLSEYNKWKREAAERQVINNICQASAAEVMKMAMIELHKQGVNLLIQVYDELVFEELEQDIGQALNIVIDTMENCIQLKVPLVAEGKIAKNWAEAK